jgi:uncharacterized protein (UPF0548 family)
VLYDNVRLRILSAIASRTADGYREADARFLIGTNYWNSGRAEDAVRWWRPTRVDRTQRYANSSTAILDAVRGVDWQTVDAARVKEILTAERRQWLDFWWNRVRQFGYTFAFETFRLMVVPRAAS